MEPTLNDMRLMLESRLALRAKDDPEFRQRLLDDPRGAVAEEFGKALPQTLKLHVIDPAADTLTIVLPAVSKEDGELSDAQLEVVAGGSLWTDLKEWLGIKKVGLPTQTAVAGVRG